MKLTLLLTAALSALTAQTVIAAPCNMTMVTTSTSTPEDTANAAGSSTVEDIVTEILNVASDNNGTDCDVHYSVDGNTTFPYTVDMMDDNEDGAMNLTKIINKATAGTFPRINCASYPSGCCKFFHSFI